MVENIMDIWTFCGHRNVLYFFDQIGTRCTRLCGVGGTGGYAVVPGERVSPGSGASEGCYLLLAPPPRPPARPSRIFTGLSVFGRSQQAVFV